MFWDADKSRIVKYTAAALLLAAALCALAAWLAASAVQAAFYEKELALVGVVKQVAPGEADRAARILLGEADGDAANDGRIVLSSYAAGKLSRVADRPGYRETFQAVVWAAFLIFAITASLFLFFSMRFYRKQERLLKRYIAAADRMLEGDTNLRLPEGTDGATAALGQSLVRLGDRLRFTVDKLKKEKQFLSDMLSDISHQLKTPIAAIKVYAEACRDHPEISPAQQAESIRSICGQTERLEYLVHSLLRIARLEAGAVFYKANPKPVADTVRAACEGLRAQFEEKGIALSIKEEKADILLRHDVAWTAEAFSNIIKNSCEHGRFGGFTEISISETPLTVSVRISDDGGGIPDTQLPRIFDRFFKGGNAVKSSNIGIGLSISKAVIEQQGGDITVTSRLGEGTQFMITFLKNAEKK